LHQAERLAKIVPRAHSERPAMDDCAEKMLITRR
jgi:hypothetical protein